MPVLQWVIRIIRVEPGVAVMPVLQRIFAVFAKGILRVIRTNRLLRIIIALGCQSILRSSSVCIVFQSRIFCLLIGGIGCLVSSEDTFKEIGNLIKEAFAFVRAYTVFVYFVFYTV